MAKKLIDGHPLPKRISDRDFEELVTPAGSKSRDFEIPRRYAKEAKKSLDFIVDYIAEGMQTPGLKKKAVRVALGSALRALNAAQRHLKEISSEKSRVFRSLAIAAMVNDDWLREISQGEFQPTPWSARTPFGPNHGLAERESFVEQCPFEITAELVNEIEAALSPSFERLTAINKRGGVEAFPYRGDLVRYLIRMSESWGRSPIGGPRSDFVTFCKHVFEGVGWNPIGVQSLVSRELGKRKAKRAKGKGRFQNRAF
jgi:hypothetical protein